MAIGPYDDDVFYVYVYDGVCVCVCLFADLSKTKNSLVIQFTSINNDDKQLKKNTCC